VKQEFEVEITEKNLGEIINWGERVFATACVRVGLEVVSQIPVGDSKIDFKVKTRSGNLRLIEVTESKRKNARRLQRKMRQLKNMKESGLGYCLLCNEELINIQRRNETS
jgi:hypothetical protein